MKFLINLRASQISEFKKVMATKEYTVVRDLVTDTTSTDSKYATIDTESKTISLFNKISEDKIRAIKIGLAHTSTDFLVFLNIILTLDQREFTVSDSAKEIQLCDEKSDPKRMESISKDMWYKIKLVKERTYPYCVNMKTMEEFPKVTPMDKKEGFAILEINYSFCDTDSKSSRDIFSNVIVYSSPILEDFLFAKMDSLIEEFADKNHAKDIFDELTTPTFNKNLKALRKDDEDLVFAGIKSANGRTVWVTMETLLQYMDMSKEIFDSCIAQLKDLKKEMEYEIPGLEDFEHTTVNNLKVCFADSNILFKFANIIDMKQPCYNLTTGKFTDWN